MRYPIRITEILTWPTILLVFVRISPILVVLFRQVTNSTFLIQEEQGVFFNGDYLAMFIVILSYATLWKWLYDAAFSLHQKYYHERNHQGWSQAIFIFPLFPLIFGILLLEFSSEPEQFRFYWVWSLFVLSWLLMCLFAYIRITWLLSKLEGKGRYLIWFTSLLFWLAGIWSIQPILREAWNREIEKKDIDHFIA